MPKPSVAIVTTWYWFGVFVFQKMHNAKESSALHRQCNSNINLGCKDIGITQSINWFSTVWH